MKLQHLSVIFVIIIIPISLVLSEYTRSHITTIELQTQYSTKLINATYDATKVFQLNTANNRYSTIGNSKIRDIEASINTFYNTLSVNLGSSGYDSNDLKSYIPAILCTLYDGYYIYTSYFDTEVDTNGDGTPEGDYRYGLKPFITYSCRYIKGSNYDFVVNYTLDNTITFIGTINGSYVTKTGHLINSNIYVDDEILTENLIIINDDGSYENFSKDKDGKRIPTYTTYEYIVYNNNRYYYNKDYYNNNNTKKFFTYSDQYRKNYVSFNGSGKTDVWNYLNNKIDTNDDFKSDSAQKYYNEAKNFTIWVNDNLKDITAEHAVDLEGDKITDFAVETNSEPIFKIDNNNDPLQSGSTFNEHRQNVIRKTIETNLTTAIANYNRHSQIGFEFAMPKLEEDEWYKIENNICFVSFLQGMPIGAKLFNDYCVVSNNTNQEAIGNDSIFIIDDKGEYHHPGCKALLEGLKNNKLNINGAYTSNDFKRKTVALTGEDANAHSQLTGTDENNNAFLYPQGYTACYDCIVTSSDAYSTDNIIAGNIKDISGNILYNETDLKKLKEKYLIALARCRYDLYTTNGYFGYK